jgi:hypothetical protein
MTTMLLFYIFLISKENTPTWDNKSHSAGQETECLLWFLKDHHCVHKSHPQKTLS